MIRQPRCPENRVRYNRIQVDGERDPIVVVRRLDGEAHDGFIRRVLASEAGGSRPRFFSCSVSASRLSPASRRAEDDDPGR